MVVRTEYFEQFYGRPRSSVMQKNGLWLIKLGETSQVQHGTMLS